MLVKQTEGHQNPLIPISEGQTNPEVRDTRVPGRAKNLTLVLINLKNASQSPHQKKYSLRPESWAGLQPIISKFLCHGLLQPTNSLCNIPILAGMKKDYSYRIV